VQNQTNLDFIWLDYCATVKHIKEDIESLKQITNINSVIAVTLFRGRDSTINDEGRNIVLDGWFSTPLPYFKSCGKYDYFEDGSAMTVYVFKVPSYLRKILPKEVNNGFNKEFSPVSPQFA